jgi:fatty acid desaturase
MHDATHGALFTKRWMNNWAGIITGLMNAMDAPGRTGLLVTTG